MSSSTAPSWMACRASASLTAVLWPPWGKADRRGRQHAGACQALRGPPHIIRQNADTGHLVPPGKLYPLFQLPDGQRRPEQAMVNHLGNLLISVIHRKPFLAKKKHPLHL
jgi:hypothetical protein